MEKVHEMVVKCVEVLDPEIKIQFEDVPAGYSLPGKKQIILPLYQYDFLLIFRAALRETAHVMFSTKVPESKLEYEVSMSLDTIEQAFVNYHFCQRFPKFEVTLNRFYKEGITGDAAGGVIGADDFWKELEYALFDVDVAEGCNSDIYNKLYDSGIIQELWKLIQTAKSTEELIPGAKNLVQRFKDLNLKFPA
ncbi:MAG: hypothetical protein GY775_08745 [Candidatus Scalindua sp.]|nr:hypothetical protein [Candidatus Scalindua sp.]